MKKITVSVDVLRKFFEKKELETIAKVSNCKELQAERHADYIDTKLFIQNLVGVK